MTTLVLITAGRMVPNKSNDGSNDSTPKKGIFLSRREMMFKPIWKFINRRRRAKFFINVSGKACLSSREFSHVEEFLTFFN